LLTASKQKETRRSSIFDPLTDTNRDQAIFRGLNYDGPIRLSSLKKSKSRIQAKENETPKLLRRRNDIKLNKLYKSKVIEKDTLNAGDSVY
jgi:hypothetical protein